MQETDFNQDFRNYELDCDPNVESLANGAQNHDQLASSTDQLSSDHSFKFAARSPLRLKYEAEVSSLKKRIGSLESMRLELGLSQRKMCQLLLVDPSAWTRWTKSGGDAPPHIYRMLQWYLAVQEKYPALDIQFWLSNLTRASEAHGWEANISKLSQSIVSLKAERDRTTEALKSLDARLLLAESDAATKTTIQTTLEPMIEASRSNTLGRSRWLLPVTSFIAFVLGAACVFVTMSAWK